MNEIVKKCLESGIHVELSLDGYWISGFAKSGHGVLSFEPDEGGYYTLKLRYDTVEKVKTFGDLVAICFEWCDSYQSRGYGWDWEDLFVEYGYLKRVPSVQLVKT